MNPNGASPGVGYPPRYNVPGHQGMGGPVRPTVPPSGELWIETKTAEGKSYYYHAVSRQTTWTKPSGSGVQVMTQSEVENMSKQQQMQKREMPP